LSGAAFCAASLAMTLLNKAALTPTKRAAAADGNNIPLPVVTLLAVQCLATLLLTCLACSVGLGRLPPRIPFKQWLRLWLPVNALFAAMVATSFLALRHMGVPMLTVLKNLTSLLVIVGDKVVFGKTYGAGVWATLGLMTASALCAAASDLEFSLLGYGWQLANNVATAAYSLALRLAIVKMGGGGGGGGGGGKVVGVEEEEEEELLGDEEATPTAANKKSSSSSSSSRPDDVGMVIYNNLGALPLLIILALCSGEPQQLMRPIKPGDAASPSQWSALAQDSRFVWAALASCATGFLLSVASMWFMRCTTATTFSLVGSLNKVPLAVLGAVLFAPAPGKAPAWTSPGHVASVAVGLCAGVVFARAKSREDEELEEEKRRRAAAAAAAAVKGEGAGGKRRGGGGEGGGGGGGHEHER
jgi:GDP-mannose transporter